MTSTFGIEIKDANGKVIADSQGVINIVSLLGSAYYGVGSGAFNCYAQNGVYKYASPAIEVAFSLERTATVCLMMSGTAAFQNSDGIHYETEAASKAQIWPALTSEGVSPPQGEFTGIVMGDNSQANSGPVQQTPTVFRFMSLPAGEYVAVIRMMTPPQQYTGAPTYSPFALWSASLQVLRFGF